MNALNLLLIVIEAGLASVALPVLASLLARACPKNAARRRLVWAMMFAVLLALPLVAALSPSLAVITLHRPAAVVPGPVIVAPPAADPSLSAPTAALLLGLYAWIIGALWIVGRSVVGLVRLHFLKRGAKPASPERLPLRLPRGPQVLLSPECAGPVTWGVLRPVILLPDDALDWPQPKLEAALRHELAHVNARDCLVQTLALLTCALYWPNPLVRRAADSLRREAEAAADDVVLASGVRPSDYASLLLDLANDWAETHRSELEMAMASPPILTERVQSILSPDASRTGATAMDTFKLALVGAAALAALALARPSVAEVQAAPSAPADPQAQQAAPAAPSATAAAPAPAGAAIGSRGQVIQMIQRGGDKRTAPPARQTIELAQKDFAAPPADVAAAAKAAPGTLVPIPYNPVTDDPASPGYIPAGQPGAGHPVPAELAKLLNARKASTSWNLTWAPNPGGTPAPPAPAAVPAPAQPADPPAAAAAPLPPAPPLASAGQPVPQTKIGIRLHDAGIGSVQGPGDKETPLSPEQRSELNRRLAEISPKIEKALKDAHIAETVSKALKDADVEDTVAKALKDARASGIVAHGRFDLGVDQGRDAPKP